jgi:hypothetical protein
MHPKKGPSMPIKIYYRTISIYYKTSSGPALLAKKSTSAPKLIFSIHSIECGIFCRLYQDLPRSGFFAGDAAGLE